MCELSVCTLERYFVPFFVNTHEQFCKSLLQKKMAKTKKTPYRKVCRDDGVRPSTSKDTGEGPKKLEKRVSIQNGFHF